MNKPKRVTQGWREINGDGTLAIDWPLDENSIVMEIGAYEGRWAKQMAEKYHCNIHAFEPQDWAYAIAQENLEGLRVNLYPYGLWTHTTKMPIGDYGRDGASILKTQHQDIGQIEVMDIFDFMYTNYRGKNIDVGLINIEGGEFVLLPYLIGMGLINRFNHIWIQFHLFVTFSERKVECLFTQMERTHKIMWDYFPTAVAWERK